MIKKGIRFLTILYIALCFLSCNIVFYNPFLISSKPFVINIPDPIRISDDNNSSRFVSLVWTGSEYGVCWEDNRDGNYEIYFARLDSTGTKIGVDVRITDDPAVSVNPGLVWTGSIYGVCWEDNRDGNFEIYYTWLDQNGLKIDSDVRITNDLYDSRNASLVWSGAGYGVCWEDNRDTNYMIYFAKLDADGYLIGGSETRVPSDIFTSYNSSLVWTGSEYGICWEDNRDGNFEIYFTRIDTDGNLIGSDKRVTNDAFSSYNPGLVSTGDGSPYGVCWEDDRDGNFEIYFARIDASGSKIGNDMRITADGAVSVSSCIVYTGTEYGVSWQDERDGNKEIYFARINPSGSKIGTDIRITNDAGNSLNPDLVWAGTGYGIGWEDDRDGNYEIYFNTVAP